MKQLSAHTHDQSAAGHEFPITEATTGVRRDVFKQEQTEPKVLTDPLTKMLWPDTLLGTWGQWLRLKRTRPPQIMRAACVVTKNLQHGKIILHIFHENSPQENTQWPI